MHPPPRPGGFVILETVCIWRCSVCPGYIETYGRVASAYFMPTSVWTDGENAYFEGFGAEAALRCPHCRVVVWARDLTLIDEVPAGDPGHPDRRRAKRPGRPNRKGYLLALWRGPLERERRLYVRLHASWLDDDRLRYGWDSKEELERTPKEQHDMRALLELLDVAHERERLLAGELHRELGEYEPALAVLAAPFEGEHERLPRFIRRLAARRRSLVGRLER